MSAKTQRDLEGEFLQRWEFHNGPTLERQYVFCPGRKYAADFAHIASRVIVELDGDTWGGKGRHVRGGGYDKDRERDNLASSQGWTVFRLTGSMLTHASRHWIELIMDTIEKLTT